MTIKQIGSEYDYDVEFIVDMTSWTSEQDEVMDECGEYRHACVLEVIKGGFNGSPKFGASKPHHEIYGEVKELLDEWQNLIMNNDCKDRKVRVVITVEEVK